MGVVSGESHKYDSSLPVIETEIGPNKIRAILDTGSSITALNKKCFDLLPNKVKYRRCETSTNLFGVGGNQLRTYGCYLLPIRIQDQIYWHPFYIIELNNTEYQALLGIDFFRGHNMEPDIKKNCLRPSNGKKDADVCFGIAKREGTLTEAELVPARTEIMLAIQVADSDFQGKEVLVEKGNQLPAGIHVARSLSKMHGKRTLIRLCNTTSREISLPEGLPVCTVSTAPRIRISIPENKGRRNPLSQDDFDLAHLTPDEKEKVWRLLKQNSDCFARTFDELGSCPLVKHKIELTSKTPIHVKAYRCPESLTQQLKTEIEKLEDHNIIRKSVSPWASGLVVIKKPDNSLRIAVDFRRLNDVSIKDRYPLPNITDTIHKLSGSKYFSVLDATSGFYQCEMDKDSIPYTAFNSPFGHYEFLRMPFGLCNSPSTYQRLVDYILMGLQDVKAFIYVDDLVICSPDLDSHLKDLQKVFDVFRPANLKFKPSKCQLAKTEIQYLGHKINEYGMQPADVKIRAVAEFPTPTNADQVRQFLGLVGFYRAFIKNCADISRPLTRLLKKDTVFTWEDNEQESFETLKRYLTCSPVLILPNFQKRFYLSTDASGFALGAVLEQVGEDNKKHPVAYASRHLRANEINYSAIEKEALGAYWGILHFNYLLYGREFTLIVDQSALRWLFSHKNVNSRLFRWQLSLQAYTYDVEYKKGRLHSAPDALSRNVAKTTEKVSAVQEVHETRNDRPSDIAKLQENDPVWKPFIEYFKNNVPLPASLEKQGDQFFIDDDEVLRRVSSSDSRSREKAFYQICLPRELKEDIMHKYHDHPTAGHLAYHKVLERVRRDYYWPHMSKEIKEYTRSCHSCQSRKYTAPPKVPLQKFQEVDRPFQIVSMDFLGPLPLTENGNRFLVVFVDRLTRYIEAIPTPDIKANTVSKALVEHIIARYGAPEGILSDCGPQLMSEIFREACNFLDIKNLYVVPYHQSANLVERHIQNLSNVLSHYVRKEPATWDLWIPYVLMALRSAVNDSTKESSHFLLYGRDMRLPFQAIWKQDRVYYNTLDDFNRMRSVYRIAKEELSKSAEKQQNYRMRNAHSRNFGIGDIVYWHLPVIKGEKKFAKKHDGPYRVEEVLNEVNYKIKNLVTGKSRVVHVERLKRGYIRQPYPTAERDESENFASKTTRRKEKEMSYSSSESSSDEEASIMITENNSSTEEEREPPKRYPLRSRGVKVPDYPWIMAKKKDLHRTERTTEVPIQDEESSPSDTDSNTILDQVERLLT